jgi:two-component system LytT family response regulator
LIFDSRFESPKDWTEEVNGMKLRTLIVDDELFSRNKIRAFLEDYPEFEVVGECEDGRQTASAILSRKPDVVFLDVEIPGQNGLELLDSLPPAVQPSVILVTAFDKYAVRAFEIQALDYLLKPFNKARFAKAISRLRQLTALSNSVVQSEELKVALQEVRRETQDYERIVVKSGSRIIFLQSSLIEWIEAQGDYVMVHVGKANHLVRETMAGMANRLDPSRFVRIHRSAIVNLDFVQELRPLWGGDYRVFLRDGTQITLSRNYRSAVRDKLPPITDTHQMN